MPIVESKLANEFPNIFQKGIGFTNSLISLTANELCYSPRILAEKDAFQHFLTQNKFTNKFLQFRDKLKEDIEENENNS